MITVTTEPIVSRWSNALSTWRDTDLSWSAEFGTYYHFLSTTECGISDSMSSTSHKSVSSQLTVTDKLKRSTSKPIKAVISVQGSAGKFVNKSIADSLTVSDDIAKGIDKRITCPLSISITYYDNIEYTLHFVESVQINDSISKTPYSLMKSYLHIEDKAVKSVGKCVDVPVRIVTDYTDYRILTRVFEETVHIISQKQNLVEKIRNEKVSVLCEMLRHANGVMSDIVIATGDIDIDVPCGYSPWQPFFAGDYTYKEAMLKIDMDSEVVGKNVVLDDFTVFVDLPDIQDHGIVDVNNGKADIKFELDFFRPPEVTITMTSATGTVCIPTITKVDRFGFSVELKDTSGNYVDGKISWTALGC